VLTLGPLAFSAPWLLLGLGALPILWLLLRAVPPAPIRRRFPAVALLLGLRDDESLTERTPWWLLLLRLLAVAALIAGFAGPFLFPQAERQGGDGPLLILTDATWADARDWPARRDRIEALLSEAESQGRPVAMAALTDLPAEGPVFVAAGNLTARLETLAPKAWEPTDAEVTAWADQLTGNFDTYWLSDGLARDGRDALLSALETHGSVTVFQTPRATLGLRPIRTVEGEVSATLVRTPMGSPVEATLLAIGLDPTGVERVLASVPVSFGAGENLANVAVPLPSELRNRVTRFEISGQNTAGAVALADDGLRRREVALVDGGTNAEALDLLSPLHYLRRALAPTTDLIEGAISDILPANPDVIILADVARMTEAEESGLQDWVAAGGLLVRFAGPRLAASDIARSAEDPLLPVRLRSGGRSVGGTMSWGEPKALAPFTQESPFFGLAVPEDVTVQSQVVAQPDPTLASRVIAQLADGTPLVTRKDLGLGQVALFHVTANAEWSTLPLSGLFVQMLDRLAVTSSVTQFAPQEMAGTVWLPQAVLDANGHLDRVDTLAGVAGEDLALGIPSADLPPGLYATGGRVIALNTIGSDRILEPAIWPARIPVEGITARAQLELKGWVLGFAALLLALDMVATLALSGRLGGGNRGRIAGIVLGAILIGSTLPHDLQAQATDADTFARAATQDVVLAHVVTGDTKIDDAAQAGLVGLSNALAQRTSVEPATPMAVNIETDELTFFPLLYWPVTADMPLPSRAAYDKLNRYLHTGGMILFDTRDANISGFGSATPEGRKLQSIARGLDIPRIEPVPSDHVLTRSFYLLQDFPGRWSSRDIWVEAARPDAEQVEGMPFRNLNDGVTPVVIGGNDWAAAWAVGPNGQALFPVGRGLAGERQREISLRFGVNLVMHVLTGNYKSDQVHVPALLDRLGQ
jgi:hypothetical protein